jgi:2-(1,2-epoxy-1,2-dihydrophenyl)acetyl-CoA isomerase
MADFVKLNREGRAAVVILNRPEAYNAFNLELMTEFVEILTGLASDPAVTGVVITGEGKAFCAGGDLLWALNSDLRPAAAFHQLAQQFHAAMLEIRRMAKPVAAAINGVAAGGGFSLALGCDFRVMDEKATLKQAYTSSGLCIDGCGTFTLPRLVGMARALEIAACDKPIPAEQALEWGLVTKVVSPGSARDQAMEMITEGMQTSVQSFGMCKNLFNDSMHTPLETQMEKERAGLELSAESPHGQEGLKAFSEKRKPNFI